MMSMQARESLRPFRGPHHPLRAYAVDSPRAKARLVVLALLADGRLDECEISALERRGVYTDLGITREDFVQVLYDFCADVAAHLSAGSGGYRLTPTTLAGLFNEVADGKAREKLLRHMVAVISSDGKLSDAEENLFLNAMDHWNPPKGNMAQTIFPELHYS
ncbi:MAG: TerB family tellurite resistance protein [Rhodocyclaceae bacterium]|nr:TerB family tellurite resistance protein [Rhodocyclaceae bacterium]